MPKLLLALVVAAFAFSAGCAFANVNRRSERQISDAERATPPARTSMDESDGPTQPRTSAQRPIGHETENETEE